MKKTLVVGMCLTSLATAGVAEPVLGTWKTQPDDGSYAHVDMYSCGAAVCGKIAKTFNADGAYQSPNQGKQLVIDMVPQGDGAYEGKVWRPSNDKIYLGKMTVNGDQLALRGCVAGGLICSKQTWSRIK